MSAGCRPSGSPSSRTAAGARAGHGLHPGDVRAVINKQLHIRFSKKKKKKLLKNTSRVQGIQSKCSFNQTTATKFQRKLFSKM